jgi:UDP-N-acetyl-D-mannosaminuronate dehydrogenase
LLDEIEALYQKRTAVLGVVGMGYVGLPLALAAAAAKFSVIGFDIDPKKVDRINSGSSYLKHIGSAQIAGAVSEKRLRATADFQETKAVDAIIPTTLANSNISVNSTTHQVAASGSSYTISNIDFSLDGGGSLFFMVQT